MKYCAPNIVQYFGTRFSRSEYERIREMETTQTECITNQGAPELQ